MKEGVLFETERLSIRSATLQDAEMYFELWSNPNVMKNVGFPQGYSITLDEVEERILKQGPSPFDHMLVVALKTSGEAIGECKIESPNQEGMTETHIKILPPFWGQKFGLEIKRGLLDFIFTQTDCLIVQSTPNVENIPSIKMQEAVGGVRVVEDIYEFSDEMKEYTCPVHQLHLSRSSGRLEKDEMIVEHYLTEFVTDQIIPIFAITGCDDFEHALTGWQPRDLMPQAESMIVFGRPFIEHPRSVDEKTHIADDGWWTENIDVFEQIGKWRGAIINILDNFGFGVSNYGGFWLTKEPTFSYRLVMERAGIGVYGRFGVCIHPEYGCYFRVGVLLTDAELTPTPASDLAGFTPCDGCRLCANVCPVKAIDGSKPPETGYNRELCMRFILKIKEKHKKYLISIRMVSKCATAVLEFVLIPGQKE